MTTEFLDLADEIAIAQEVTGLAALRYFLILNNWMWSARPSIDDAEVLAVASGSWGEVEMAAWRRLRFASATTPWNGG